MSHLFEVAETNPAQAGLAFPQSLTDAYKLQGISEFVGLQKHKAILEKLAVNPRTVHKISAQG
jgi:hypothetical protein